MVNDTAHSEPVEGSGIRMTELFLLKWFDGLTPVSSTGQAMSGQELVSRRAFLYHHAQRM